MTLQALSEKPVRTKPLRRMVQIIRYEKPYRYRYCVSGQSRSRISLVQPRSSCKGAASKQSCALFAELDVGVATP